MFFNVEYIAVPKLAIFFLWVFFRDHSRITGLQGKVEGISLTPHYHFHSLHRHLDISPAITAESSPVHIVSSRTRNGMLWFPSTSRQPLSYATSYVTSLIFPIEMAAAHTERKLFQ